MGDSFDRALFTMLGKRQKPMSDKVRYIITCPARTGSSALVNYLMSHPDICSHGEVFAPKAAVLYGIHARLNPPLLDLMLELRTQDPIKFLHGYVFYAGKRKAVGLKFKFEELSLPQYQEIADHIRRDTDIKVIFLTRKNLLKRYVSQHLAIHVYKKFNQHKGQPLPPAATIRLSAAECEKEFAYTRERERKFRDYFCEHPVLEVTYEDLVDTSEHTLGQIQDFLGVERHELTTKLAKIQQQPMSKVLENYDALNAHFAGTDYAVFFDDIVR